MQMMQRGDVRHRYNLEGNGCTDCLYVSSAPSSHPVFFPGSRVSADHFGGAKPLGNHKKKLTQLAGAHAAATAAISSSRIRK